MLATRFRTPLSRHAPVGHTVLQATTLPCAYLLRRWQATAAAAGEGPAVTATNRAQATMKRFWKSVGLEHRDGAFAVTLDNRALKTPSGNPLLVPQEKKTVATLIAAEWENQTTVLKPHALPMTSLVSRVIDAMHDEPTRVKVRDALLDYLDTDTVCFIETEPPHLVKLQEDHWEPLLAWARTTFDVEIVTHDSVLPSPQPAATLAKLDLVLEQMSPWELAALERATYTTKSLIIALGLVKGYLNAEQASLAAHVEVNSQIERWGEVEDTHDVDFHDVRKQLSSSAVLLSEV